MIGQVLGSYQVLAKLGEGGMGEVFRARDTKLNRDVAMKVLPAAFADDPERLARFTREAQTLASLNHPNIATIHGIEEIPAVSGSTGPGSRALVMELVEGEDLSAQIARGPIPIAEALPIARQIVEALEAAHEQGIVHRDLKPANIKVRPDGTVKVLDFGLAKAMEQAPGSGLTAQGQTPVDSPTITSPAHTLAGTIIGTAAYMAPEQARGKAVDTRADIWAFGVVLYEMLTATRLFAGDSVPETLGLIFSREPDLTALPAATPARVRALIARCLVKDPRQRLRDIGEARIALEGGVETAAPPTPAPAQASASGGRRPWMAAFGVALLGMVALAVPALRHLREAPPAAPPETHVDIVTPATDDLASFALSPDGRQIVFVASDDGAPRLWLRSLSSASAQPLSGTEGARAPFWSPDGRSIAFFAGGALRRLDLEGGAPRTLAPSRFGIGGTWHTDGEIAFWSNPPNHLMRVPATGGTPAAVTPLSLHGATHFLPDGKGFVFNGRLDPTGGAGIYLGALDTSAPKLLSGGSSRGTLSSGASRIYVLPSGWLVWQQASALLAQRLDVAKATLVGEALTLADGVAGVSVSATGLIAYRTARTSRRQLTWVDRSGRVLGTIGEPDGSLITPRVSPDGRRVAVGRTQQGNLDIWLLEGVRTSRLTVDAADDRYAVWSPDGARIAFASFRAGDIGLYQTLTDRTGAEERIPSTDPVVTPSNWSPDGRYLLYYSTTTGIGVHPMAGDGKPAPVLDKRFLERDAVFSPDGRWVAYQSEESGRPEIYVRAFLPPRTAGASPELGSQVLVSTDGGVHPAWSPDGKELYYLSPAAAMMAAPISVSGSALSAGAPVMLFPTRIHGGGTQSTPLGRQYDVAPDGRFLINTVLDSTAAPITLIQNWDPERKK